LIEVGYTELQQCPVEAMERIYREFGLEGFAAAREEMARLPSRQAWELAGHRRLTSQQTALVASRWEFAFREWGYAVSDS